MLHPIAYGRFPPNFAAGKFVSTTHYLLRVSSTLKSNNALPRVALGGFNITSATTNGVFPSFNYSHQAAQTCSESATLEMATVLYTSNSWYGATYFYLNVYLFSEIGSKTFDDYPFNWLKSFSVFQATDDRFPMSSAEKMIHSLSLLSGEAYALINGYGCNGSLYAPALAGLEKYFGHPNKIVNAFLKKLANYRPLPDNSSKLYAVFCFYVNLSGHDSTVWIQPWHTFQNKCQSSVKRDSNNSQFEME